MSDDRGRPDVLVAVSILILAVVVFVVGRPFDTSVGVGLVTCALIVWAIIEFAKAWLDR